MTLNLGQTLSSGHGSVSFSSDAECSQFVKSFFPQCGAHMQSCHEVGNGEMIKKLASIYDNFLSGQVEMDRQIAVLVVGCLFSHYPGLMIPLLSNKEQEQSELFNII